MTTDLTTWRAQREDANDADSYAFIEWPGFNAFWETTPIEDIDGLTWGEFEGYLARAKAITAIAYVLILNLNQPDRPYHSQVSIDLGDEGGPSLSAQIPLKLFRICVSEAVEMIDGRKDDAEAPIVDSVIDAREETRRWRQVTNRVHRLTSQDDHLLPWVWANLRPLGYEKRMAWLDRFEEEVMVSKALLAAGKQPDSPLLDEAVQFQQDTASA